MQSQEKLAVISSISFCMLCNMASTSFGSGSGRAGGGGGGGAGGSVAISMASISGASISGASGTVGSDITSTRRGGPAPLRFDFTLWKSVRLDFRLSSLLSFPPESDTLRPSSGNPFSSINCSNASRCSAGMKDRMPIHTVTHFQLRHNQLLLKYMHHAAYLGEGICALLHKGSEGHWRRPWHLYPVCTWLEVQQNVSSRLAAMSFPAVPVAERKATQNMLYT